MRVAENGRRRLRVRRRRHLADRERLSRRVDHLGLAPGRADALADPLGGAPHVAGVRVVRADGRDRDQLGELGTSVSSDGVTASSLAKRPGQPYGAPDGGDARPSPTQPDSHRRSRRATHRASVDPSTAAAECRPDRAQDDELSQSTPHAYWREVGRRTLRREPSARVYAALGRPEPALHHANRCLELVRAEPDAHEDWDLASALEVHARVCLRAAIAPRRSATPGSRGGAVRRSQTRTTARSSPARSPS